MLKQNKNQNEILLLYKINVWLMPLTVDKSGFWWGSELRDGGDLQKAPTEDPLSTVHLQLLRICCRTNSTSTNPSKAKREEHWLQVCGAGLKQHALKKIHQTSLNADFIYESYRRLKYELSYINKHVAQLFFSPWKFWKILKFGFWKLHIVNYLCSELLTEHCPKLLSREQRGPERSPWAVVVRAHWRRMTEAAEWPGMKMMTFQVSEITRLHMMV